MFQCRPAIWMSIYQFTFFFAYGVYLPFRGLWLEKLGITDADIGMLVGLGLTSRCIINFTLTPLFHKVEHLIPALRWSMFLGVLGFISFIYIGELKANFWALAILIILFNLAIGPAVAISDAISNHYAADRQLDYGYTRLWGAVALTVASASMGLITTHWGISAVPILGALGLFVTFLGTMIKPSVPMKCNHKKTDKINIIKVLCDKKTLVFILVASLLEGSHGGYYFFSAIYWKDAGYSTEVIGYLWSLSTISVIVFYFISRKAFSNWQVKSLFKLAAISVVIRWALMAYSTELPVLIVCQILHGITFSGTILSSVRYVEENKCHNYMGLQALYHAIPAGFALALVSAACGWIYHHSDINVFWFMAAMGIPCLFLSVIDDDKDKDKDKEHGLTVRFSPKEQNSI